MLYRVLIGAGIGLLVGAIIGVVRKSQGSQCVLTAHPMRAAFIACVIGTGIAFFTGPRVSLAEVTSADEFDRDVLEAEQPVLVHFYTNRCPACREFAPEFKAVARQFASELHFAAVDVRNAPRLARRYRIRCVPTVLLFDGGELVRRLDGCTDPEDVRLTVDYYLGDE
jgi:thioredoxin 1